MAAGFWLIGHGLPWPDLLSHLAFLGVPQHKDQCYQAGLVVWFLAYTGIVFEQVKVDVHQLHRARSASCGSSPLYLALVRAAFTIFTIDSANPFNAGW